MIDILALIEGSLDQSFKSSKLKKKRKMDHLGLNAVGFIKKVRLIITFGPT